MYNIYKTINSNNRFRIRAKLKMTQFYIVNNADWRADNMFEKNNRHPKYSDMIRFEKKRKTHVD